ncbi:MAG TPA: tetratricopeptide repeat protein, partial [Planctomycetes bacterium]|nr:tetratricopeptide repeat protein [Planctomycetota bacterium]
QEDREPDPTWRVRLGTSERHCGRPENAAAAFRAALAQSPDDREIETALIELYEEIGEVDPLANLLEKRLVYAREDEAIDLRLRLARLHDEGRNEPERALSHLEWILESHPQHRDAFEHALELALRIGNPDRTLSLLERALDVPRPPTERAALLERRGRILAEELGRAEEAVASLREALSLDRTNRSVRRLLRRELETLQRWPAVLDCLFVEAGDADPEQRVSLLEEASEIAWEHLGPDAALPWLARLREERPDDPKLLARMAEAHGRAGRFEAALRALDEELTLQSDPALLCNLHVQRAHLLERELHSPSRAVAAYQDALAHASDKAPLLEELDRLYAEMGRPFERAEILEARIAEPGSGRIIELRRTLASLYCTDLARPELALPHLIANVEATRGDPREELSHLGALDAALRASARREAWVATAERELELIGSHPDLRESTPADYVRFLREELARTWDEDLGNPDRALSQLRILCASGEAHPRMRETLRELLRRTGRSAELAAHLAKELGENEDACPADWLELARLREERLSDPRGALEAYRRAETDPGLRLAALRGRRRCAERLHDWDEVAHALEAESEESTGLGRTARIAIARSLGDLCLRHFGASERTVAAYVRALEMDGHDLRTLRALQDVRAAREEYPETIALLEREVALLGDEPEDRQRRFEIWSRIARLAHGECNRPDEAIHAYREAAAIDRLAAEDELHLARLHESEGQFDDFAATFGRWCDREDSMATVDDHLELARRLMAHERGEAARARAERATALAPEHPEAWALLGELHRARNEPEKASDAFARAADHADAATGAEYLVEAAVTLGDTHPERAHELLEQAIRLDPAHLAARIGMARCASRLERYDTAEASAEAVLELGRPSSLDDPTRLEIALLGGRAAREGNRAQACRRFYEIVLEIEPDHVEASFEIAKAHFEDAEYRLARPLLEHHLELAGADATEGEKRTMLARCLESENLLDAAWSQFEEAIVLDPSIDDAHEGLVRVHERAARPEEALEALERWTRECEQPERRALAALRAAEHAIALEDPIRARRNLELSTRSDPRLAPAWALLCQLVGERGNERECRRLCSEALAAIEPGPDASPISLRAARLAEIAGEHEAAIRHYSEAARWDPRCT